MSDRVNCSDDGRSLAALAAHDGAARADLGRAVLRALAEIDRHGAIAAPASAAALHGSSMHASTSLAGTGIYQPGTGGVVITARRAPATDPAAAASATG